MFSKKFVCVVVFTIMIIGAISPAFASDNTVTVGGIDFVLPDSFEENSTYSEISYEGQNKLQKDFNTYVDGDECIQILVTTVLSSGEYSDLEPGETDIEKTINGIDGYYNDDIDGLKCFTYIEDGKMVSLLSSNDEYFSEIL